MTTQRNADPDFPRGLPPYFEYSRFAPDHQASSAVPVPTEDAFHSTDVELADPNRPGETLRFTLARYAAGAISRRVALPGHEHMNLMRAIGIADPDDVWILDHATGSAIAVRPGETARYRIAKAKAHLSPIISELIENTPRIPATSATPPPGWMNQLLDDEDAERYLHGRAAHDIR